MRINSRSVSKQPGCAAVQCIVRERSQELQEFRSSGVQESGVVRAAVGASSLPEAELRPAAILHRMEGDQPPSIDMKVAVPFCNSWTPATPDSFVLCPLIFGRATPDRAGARPYQLFAG